jgi:hypothetical protein
MFIYDNLFHKYILFYIHFFVNIFSRNFGAIAHNVPAVYDVWAARISKRKGVQYILTQPLRLQGGPNVGEEGVGT